MQDDGRWWKRRPSERQLPKLWRVEHLPGPRRRPTDWARVLLIGIGVVALTVVLARTALESLATDATVRHLRAVPGLDGTFERVHLTVLPPRYAVTRVKLAVAGASAGRPLFYAERIEIEISLRELLLNRRTVLGVRVEEPQLSIVRTSASGGAGWGDLRAKLAAARPIWIRKLEVRGGQIFVSDGTAPGEPRLWFHALDLSATGLGTRPPYDPDQGPVSIKTTGRLQRTGGLSVSASIDPWAEKLDLALKSELRNLAVADLLQAVDPQSAVHGHGTMDCIADVWIREGALGGGIKASARGAQLPAGAATAIVQRLQEWVADRQLSLTTALSARATHAVSASLQASPAQAWSVLQALVRNTFVHGVALALGQPVPPPRLLPAAGKPSAPSRLGRTPPR